MTGNANNAVCCEPALPRRKKHPELAYRSHEVLGMANGAGESSDSLDNDSLLCKDADSRARSELRSQPRGPASPRSKSVDPYLGRRRPLSAVVQIGVAGAGIPSSRQQPPYEHRLLYRHSRLDPAYKPPDHLLMTQSFPPAAHVQLAAPIGANGPSKAVDGGRLAVEEEILAAGKVEPRETRSREEIHPQEETVVDKKKLKKFKTEYKSQFRAPSKYMYTNGSWRPMSRSADSSEILQDEAVVDGGEAWIEEVAELRRKADEYKCRSEVGNFPFPSSRQEMIEQVSQRTNLSALALATTPSSVKHSKRLSELETSVDGQQLSSARTPQSLVRHHLERTTPTSGEAGVLITSPTRDHKLEPVQLQKNRASKKESKTKSTLRSSSSRTTEEPSTRASSITPTGRTSATHKSPKRAARPMSMIVPGTKSVVNGSWNSSTFLDSQQKPETKQARPTTLSTSTSTARPKTALGSRVSASEATPKVHHTTAHAKAPTKAAISVAAATKEKPQVSASETDASRHLVNGNDEQAIRKEEIEAAYRSISSKCQETLENSRNNKNEEDDLKYEMEETIKLKSPPEPTRVKSPEQIIVKSPETVNWTIPLETRIKWTSGPTKTEEESERMGYGERIRSPPMMTSPVQNPSTLIVTSQPTAAAAASSSSVVKSVSSESCSQLPRSPSLTSPSSGRSLASDVLEKARTRFDQFWGKSKDK